MAKNKVITTFGLILLYLSTLVYCSLNSINEVDDYPQAFPDNLQKLLIVVNPNLLLEMPLTGTNQEVHFKEIRLPFEIQNISAVAYNPVNNTIFVASPGKIYELNTDQKELSTLLQQDTLDVISLDVEAMSENLVFADAGTKKLKVLSLRSTSSNPVAIGNIEYIGKEEISDAIFENETHYICNGGNRETVKIVISRYDDSTLLFTNVSKPIKSIYDRQMFFKCRTNGTHFNFGNNFSLVEHIFDDGTSHNIIGVGNQVFWVDNTSELKVLTLNPNEDSILEIVRLNRRATIRKLLAFVPSESEKLHLENQRDDHQCSPRSKNKLLCSHVCLSSGLQPWLGLCWCPVDYHLHKDGLTCVLDYETDTEPKSPKVQRRYVTYTYSNWIYLYLFLATLILVLAGTTVFLIVYWKQTRSFPFVTKPYFTRMA